MLNRICDLIEVMVDKMFMLLTCVVIITLKPIRLVIKYIIEITGNIKTENYF